MMRCDQSIFAAANVHHHHNCDQAGFTKGCTTQPVCIMYLLHTDQSAGC